MCESKFPPTIGPVANIGPASLKVSKIAARRNFTIGILSGQPHFEIVAFCGSESHVSGAMNDNSIWEFKALQDFLGISSQGFEVAVGIFHLRELDDFYLV